MGNRNSSSPEYQLDIIHDVQQLSNEEDVGIIDINSSTHSINGKVYGLDSNLWPRDELDEHETTRHSWFHDEYNEQLYEEEIWFTVIAFKLYLVKINYEYFFLSYNSDVFRLKNAWTRLFMSQLRMIFISRYPIRTK